MTRERATESTSGAICWFVEVTQTKCCHLASKSCELTHAVAMPQEIQHICANGKGGSGFDEFLQVHRPQLEASHVPQRYWKTLYNKLENEVRPMKRLDHSERYKGISHRLHH